MLTLQGGVLREEERLVEYGFEAEDPPNAARLTGVPAKRMEELRAEADAARKQAQALSEELGRLAQRERDEALSRWSWLKYERGLRPSAVCRLRRDEFFLSGWLPAADAEDFKRAAEALGCVCSFEHPGRGDHGHVPVKLKESFWTRIFAPFVKMYGYPRLRRVRPAHLHGHHLLPALRRDVRRRRPGCAACAHRHIYAEEKRGMWLGHILAAVGCAAVVFGFVYGSVFGNEHLLPGFKVLEGGGVMQILLVSAGGGVVLILISGVLNILTAFRQHDYRAALFSANGVTGVLFLAGIVGCAVSDALFATSLLSKGPVWLVFALLLLSIWLGEPLTMLFGLAPKEHGHKTSAGMMLLEGFFRAVRGLSLLALQLPELPAESAPTPSATPSWCSLLSLSPRRAAADTPSSGSSSATRSSC